MDQEKIGKFIAEVRKQRGLTQKELAEKIGISDKTISKWECGNSIPDISYLESLCDSLDIKVNELLSGERLSDKSYSEKAEENIMALMKENESNKKGSILRNIIGVVFIIMAFTCMLFVGAGRNMSMLYSFFDFVTLLILVLLCAAIVLLSGKKKKQDVLGVLQKTIIPCGILDSLFQVVILMHVLSEPSMLGPSLAVCILSLLYAMGAYLIITVWKARGETA